MSQPLLIVCKYAKGSKYADEARQLVHSAAAFGYKVRAMEAPDEGDWWRNTANKPRYILEAFKEHNGPLLSLDADCRIRQPLDEMLSLLRGADVAVKYRPNYCFTALFNAAVLLLNKTPATLSLVETWARQGERFGSLHRFVEQGAFAEGMLYNQRDLRLIPLPDRFHTMQDVDGSPPPADAVIVHLKSSRGQRKSALPPAPPRPLTDPSSATQYVTLRPDDAPPAGGLLMDRLEGARLDFKEYASRYGINNVALLNVQVARDDLAALEDAKLSALESLCNHKVATKRWVLCDFDSLFLRDPSMFADTLDVADMVLAWDRQDTGSLPSTTVIGFKASEVQSQTVLPAIRNELNRLQRNRSADAHLAQAMANVLRDPPTRVSLATFPRETVASMPRASAQTVVLSTRGELDLFGRVPSPCLPLVHGKGDGPHVLTENIHAGGPGFFATEGGHS